MFDLDSFVYEDVIKRASSMFSHDVENNYDDINKQINGKSVCVIGGAGSIGSSFIKEILKFGPSALVVADINENGLTELTRDLRSSGKYNIPQDYVTYPIDYASPIFKKMFIKRRGFDVIANFSAHKHVRSEKDMYSLEALFRNNVFNLKHFMELISEYPPDSYFCVSTDKAVNPGNMMGASKRIMEDVIFSFSDYFDVKTARFANVAFSNGSLPYGFLRRIEKLQPLSGPTDIRRYFVSSEESGEICLCACVLGKNREIFFPKLKENQMEYFDEIGSKLLQAHGYNTYRCKSELEALEMAKKLREGSKEYPVYFSAADTVGEKEYEEFVGNEDIVDMDRFSSLGVILSKPKPNIDKVCDLVNTLQVLFESESTKKDDIIRVIKNYLPEFGYIYADKFLDEKM